MDQIPTHKDFREFCELLTAATVEFLIVGGYALAFHGSPRFTGDLDILIRPDHDHVARMLQVLTDFGFPSGDTSPEYVLTQKKILQLGRVPVQIHVMTSITGVTWEEAWETRESGTYGEVPVFFLGKAALIANKTAAGRPKDLADVAALISKKHG